MCSIFNHRLALTAIGAPVILLAMFWSTIVLAEKSNDAVVGEVTRIYSNPEERRDAGLGTQLTEWLKFSGLIETESLFSSQHFKNRRTTEKIEIPSITIQAGFDFIFNDFVSAEVIFEAEHDGQRFFADLDEGFINVEIEQWGLKVGWQYLTFGEYYSHFITGPLLEFGETRGTALIIDYSLIETIEISTFIFESEIGKQGNKQKIDWGISIDYTSEDESFQFGLGFLSDLAESDEQYISGASYQHRVSAWNAYFLFGFNNYEMTAEVVQAMGVYEELDRQSDRPLAFNFELAYFPSMTTQFALRFEHSDEFNDQPRWQYGVATTWRPTNRTQVSVEYLYAYFQNNFAFDDDDHELSIRHTIAIQFSLEF